MQMLNQLPPNPSHVIPLSTAVAMTTLYRNKREVILKEEYKGRDILPLSETFRAEAISTVLAVPGCVGVRLYYGMDENEKVHLIVVAVNNANEDILPATTGDNAMEDDDPIPLLEEAFRCPPVCPPPSPLNP